MFVCDTGETGEPGETGETGEHGDMFILVMSQYRDLRSYASG